MTIVKRKRKIEFFPGKKRKTEQLKKYKRSFSKLIEKLLFEYPRLESNQHVLRHHPLKMARLPIPPRGYLQSVKQSNIKTDLLKRRKDTFFSIFAKIKWCFF